MAPVSREAGAHHDVIVMKTLGSVADVDPAQTRAVGGPDPLPAEAGIVVARAHIKADARTPVVVPAPATMPVGRGGGRSKSCDAERGSRRESEDRFADHFWSLLVVDRSTPILCFGRRARSAGSCLRPVGRRDF